MLLSHNGYDAPVCGPGNDLAFNIFESERPRRGAILLAYLEQNRLRLRLSQEQICMRWNTPSQEMPSTPQCVEEHGTAHDI